MFFKEIKVTLQLAETSMYPCRSLPLAMPVTHTPCDDGKIDGAIVHLIFLGALKVKTK